MADLAFFYGTLMTGFDRRRRTGIDPKMRFIARGWVQAALFDLGIYPAAVPAPENRVWGEVFELLDPDDVLTALDEIEGYRPGDPDSSLYIRSLVPVHLPDGTSPPAWVYFYNAPLGKAPRIDSGDYLEYSEAQIEDGGADLARGRFKNNKGTGAASIWPLAAVPSPTRACAAGQFIGIVGRAMGNSSSSMTSFSGSSLSASRCVV